METRKITEADLAKLRMPLPAEALSPHPSKKFLTSIKPIYVTERLNEVFGVGAWHIETDIVDRQEKMIVCKVKFTIPEYGISYECFGGNDNPDLGDAYKGATTDAITKIASWLGIGAEVFRGEATQSRQSKQNSPIQQRKKLTTDHLMDEDMLAKICAWLKDKAQGKTLAEVVATYYDCDTDTMALLTNEFLRRYGTI